MCELSDDDAIAAARQAIEGHITLTGGPVHVERTGKEVIVEFRRDDPPGTRGPDYDARVVLDAATGEVRSLLGG
jgi:hypothetical protein